MDNVRPFFWYILMSASSDIMHRISSQICTIIKTGWQRVKIVISQAISQVGIGMSQENGRTLSIQLAF